MGAGPHETTPLFYHEPLSRRGRGFNGPAQQPCSSAADQVLGSQTRTRREAGLC